jgi:hypothetical protein
MPEVITDKEEYQWRCPFAFELDDYVNSISGENRWFFDKCSYSLWSDDKYSVTFKSYDSPEYRNFLLSISVSRNGSNWDFSIHKKIIDPV